MTNEKPPSAKERARAIEKAGASTGFAPGAVTTYAEGQIIAAEEVATTQGYQKALKDNEDNRIDWVAIYNMGWRKMREECARLLKKSEVDAGLRAEGVGDEEMQHWLAIELILRNLGTAIRHLKEEE
jgi:hypothetical protein